MSVRYKLRKYGQYVAGLAAMVYVWTPQVAYGARSVDICRQAGARCNHFVDTYINPIMALLTVLIGIIAVISIITAGIQYSASADDPATVSKAKQRIFNTVLGLLAYLFLFAFINYLIPGGFL